MYIEYKTTIPMKPCPVCGGKPRVYHSIDFDDYIIGCPNCKFSYTELGDYGINPDEAVEFWNDDIETKGLDLVSCSTVQNEVKSEYWKAQKETYKYG